MSTHDYNTPADASAGGTVGNNPQYAPHTRNAPTNVLAIITIIAAFVFPIAGIITGHIALNQIKRTHESGHGLAKAGLILSYVFVGIWVLAFIFWAIIIAASVGGSGMVEYGY